MDHISHFLKVVVAPNVFMGSPGDKGGKFKDLQIVVTKYKFPFHQIKDI